MNDRESEKFSGILAAMGYSEGYSEEEADLVLYNTCCVRKSAEDKIYGRLGALKSQKAKQPGKVLILCGCMPQRKEVMDNLNKHHRHIDIIFGTFNKHHLPKLLHENLTANKRVIEILEAFSPDSPDAFEGQTSRFLSHKAGVTIIHGCNNFCAYCIVPYVRGRENSRDHKLILSEIKSLAADGVKEVMLLGQNVNSYSHSDIKFADLISLTEEIAGIERIRFMTSHPKDLSDDLIRVMAASQKVCKHIHLPMQSGSTAVLEKMNRGYTKEGYINLISKIYEAMPDIAITTDIIVGFPGESEADFSDTLDVAKQAKFAGAFTFMYSPREGTPAFNFKQEYPKEVIKERFDRLVAQVNHMQAAFNKRYENQSLSVMSDGISGKGGRYTGRTDSNVLVHFDADASVLNGDILNVHIDECRTFYLKGRIVI